MSKFIHKSVRLHCNLRQAYEMFLSEEKLKEWLCDESSLNSDAFSIVINLEHSTIDTKGSRIKEKVPEKKIVIQWIEKLNAIESEVEINFMNCSKRAVHCVEIHLLHKNLEAAEEKYVKLWEEALETLRYKFNDDWVIQDGDLTLTQLTGRSL